MAQNDSELIDEVRGYIGYDPDIISDSGMQSVVDIGKEEIRSYLNNPDFEFYQKAPQHTLHADRALFWFVCIGAKIHTGELAGMNMEIDALVMSHPGHVHHEHYFNSFREKLQLAQNNNSGSSGPAHTQPVRDSRTYGDNA